MYTFPEIYWKIILSLKFMGKNLVYDLVIICVANEYH